MTTTKNPTLLGYTLLGLVHQLPRSGYDLRKLFAATPLMSFSDSPGAIYPALAKLEADGYIRSVVEATGLRRRRLFRVTAVGSAALRKWLARPVTSDDIVHNLDQVLMRFSLSDEITGPAAALRLLQGMELHLVPQVASLDAFYKAHASVMTMSGRLGLDSGIRSYKTLLRWTRDAIAEYQRNGKKGKS
jgi:DNA-binding PadR family transcriptional regulator